MKKIPLGRYKGKRCEIVLVRGIGDGHQSINRHRGVIIDYTSTLLLLRTDFSKREMWIPRPREGDQVKEVTG